jgi:hypothetical protein
MCALADDDLPDVCGSPVSLTLDLTGTIPAHCGYATLPPATANLGNIANAGSVALPFLLNCNVPYAMRVSSSNGALLRTPAQAAPDGFAASLDYSVSLVVDTDLLPASAQCTSPQLTSSSCILATGLQSGDGISVGANGALTVSWLSSQQRLVAGSYRDQITLIIEART